MGLFLPCESLQSGMNYQFTGRVQMPRGFKAKQALQLALLLGVCFWLLYQIEHSKSKGEDNGGGVQSKLSDPHGIISLGRKGNAGWSSDGGVSDLQNKNLVRDAQRKEDGGGDAEIIKNDETVSSYKHWVGVHSKKGHDVPLGSVADHAGEGEKKKLVIHGEGNGNNKPRTQVKRVGKQNSGRYGKEPKGMEEILDETNRRYHYEAAGLNGENEEDKYITGSKEEVAIHPKFGFHDENGVPQDGKDVAKWTLAERDDHPIILPQGTPAEGGASHMPS